MKIKLSLIALSILAVACSHKEYPNETIGIIPQPQVVNYIGEGRFNVAEAVVSYDTRFDDLSVHHFADFACRLTSIFKRDVIAEEGLKSTGIRFVLDKKYQPEQYTIEVKKDRLTVTASTPNGVLYAIASLSQLLPDAFYGVEEENPDWTIPEVFINDWPRFAYRGLHLDVSRHFFDVDVIKRYLDVMAYHKINRFHWHLTDDQGWRIEIKKYPKLTEIGSKRDETVVLKRFNPLVCDGIPHEGFYTQEQIREVVDYAEYLGITVIPEIDLPGHMIAALAAYPELGCTGGPYKVWTRWGVANDVLCPGKEKTFEFIEDVLDEVMQLFPSEYIHIGGDECPKVEWEKCPDCQKRIAELGLKTDEEHTAEQYLQNYVTERVQKYLNDHGRKIIGWDEILEGKLAEGATVMSWRGAKGGIEAAKQGYDAIMTPGGYVYFDYYQSDSISREPFAICCPCPIEKTYSFEAYDGIPEESQKHILGVQGNLWTEYVATPEHLFYMVLPRIDALCELQWCAPERKDFERFKKDVARMLRIYDALGYTYSRNIYGEPGLPGYTGPLGGDR